ncbi:MAG: NAD-glutamate dehydrogenase [Actinomycetaceae bacterium]|nr:NAD-glutamate dehydrogenase [Actinomycetaceae bacterium]
MTAFVQTPATRDLIDKATKLAGDAVPPSIFDAYVGGASTIDSMAPEDLCGLVRAHYELASQHPDGDVSVRVFTPTIEEDGWSLGSTLVQCVTEDIPFLVDSVSIRLRTLGHTIKRLLHPVVDGHSWISVEIRRVSPGSEAGLAAEIDSVIRDVKAAVGDWDTMTALARSATEGLEGHAHDVLAWIAEGNFILLGSFERDGGAPVPGSELGLARRQSELVAELAATDTPEFLVTKSHVRALVHRHAYTDVVYVGRLVLFGLMTAGAYIGSVFDTPLAAGRVEAVFDASGLPRDSHSGKDLLQLMESYPRDILMLLDADELAADAAALIRPEAASSTTTLLHRDIFPGAAAGVVVIPRERFTSHASTELARIVQETFSSADVDMQVSVSSGPLAFISFIVSSIRDESDIDEASLVRRIADATSDWNEDLARAVRREFGEEAAAGVLERFRDSIPSAYRAQYSARVAASDFRHIDALEPGQLRLSLYKPTDGGHGRRRLKMFIRDDVSLTRILPIFSNFDLVVTDERPFTLEGDPPARIFDFGLVAPTEQHWAGEDVRSRFQEAVMDAWNGKSESDRLDALVLTAGLDSREVSILRAIAAYLRQGTLPFSRSYLQETLVANPDIARLLVDFFDARFNPRTNDAEAEAAIRADLAERIASVSSLDEERIARAFLAVIEATLRTNAYQESKPTLAFKLDAGAISFLPEPRPAFEIWVYSPRVEGVHLRFGKVARGGLRWSDRREDFRTEILGLVKAQMVKNAVIVPTGSKGGFFAKRLPPPAEREAWLAEGLAAYRLFVASLLDVTDNLVAGVVVPPDNVVRKDGDDTYLVVAADKGTAKFSDDANEVSREYGFWLGDAFASGGSAGFDHKGMGITARGAWESVKRHFRELDVDVQSQDFTVVGIGDMSGDVFGNGMLLSEHIRLVGAFDHRSVFLDPDPDAATSFAERQRLFALPGSSWEDYDSSLISVGGGVWPRSAKSIPIGDEVRRVLGLDDSVTSLTPNEAIRAILAAPVDLLWNGGIGTYVKASTQGNDVIGDRTNDAIRIDATELRCRVVGEGGNLGLSQLGRIEAALAGRRLNTDAIDNSAGVDTSDHEVNIKILLAEQVANGDLTPKQRNLLLESVTDDVATLVLRDNYEQNVLLGNARAQSPTMVHEHLRLMHWLVERGDLDRALEFLPSDEELTARASQEGRGLTSPEFAVLVAYTKLALKDDLLETSVPDDEYFAAELRSYFPAEIVDRYCATLGSHPLAREIVANSLVNSLVNRGGATFVLRAVEDTQADVGEIVRAFAAARELLDLSGFVEAVEALDGVAPTSLQADLYITFRHHLDATVRRLLQARASSIGQTVERFSPMHGWLGRLDAYLPEPDRIRRQAEIDRLVEQSVPAELAGRFADLSRAAALMDAIAVAERTGEDPDEVLRVLFDLYERFNIGRLLELSAQLPITDKWTAMAQSATEADLTASVVTLTESVLAGTDPGEGRVDTWVASRRSAVERTISMTRSLAEPSLAPLVVGLRSMRALAG